MAKKQEPVEIPLKEKLMTTDHEKLVDILVSLYDGGSDIKKQLDILFAGLYEDPKK